ncbi:MAG: hypothetical protein LBU61_02485 [Coriobacteriales bacterium]|nr:hypothetical protein [Coriobacteriales bacterium]
MDGSDPEQNGQEPQGSDGTDGQENPGVSNGQSEPGNADGSSNPPGAPSLPEAEVIAVFRNYLDERAEARVIMAMAVSEITYRNRIVRVTFDPTLVDLDNELFRLISPFQNLAEFVCIPIVSNDDVGTRVRPVIDAIETVLPDGSSLGRLTAQEIDAKVTNVSASKTMRIHDTNRTAAINALEKRLIARSKYRLQVACIDNQRELTTAILVVHHR